MGIKRFEKLVVGGGFEPPKIKSADLQSIFLNLKKIIVPIMYILFDFSSSFCYL